MLANEQISKEHAVLLINSLEQLELILSQRTNLIDRSDRESLRKIKLQTCSAVINAFEKLPVDPNKCEVTDIINHYHFIKVKLSAPSPLLQSYNAGNEEAKRDLHWKAIQAERDEVQTLYERSEINRGLELTF